MAFCGTCGAQIADGTTTCAACASKVPVGGAAVAAVPGSGLADNVAGMLAYVTIIPAIIFLVMEPYNKNRFIRFHSFQCLFFAAAWFALSIGMMILGFIPVLGLLILPLHLLVFLGILAVWVVLLIKANAGQKWKLPFIGDLAEKQANAI
jgi:uncharacterized membrane protein